MKTLVLSLDNTSSLSKHVFIFGQGMLLYRGALVWKPCPNISN